MLINIINATPDKVLNNSFAIAIENILRSFAEQKHLIIASRDFLKLSLVIQKDSTAIHQNIMPMRLYPV